MIGDYERAEITVVWLHDKPPADSHTIVFAVCEFCPREQQRVEVGDSEHGLARLSLTDTVNAYAKRWFVSCAEALSFFRGIGPSRILTSKDKRLEFKTLGTLEDEPPNEVLVLLDEVHAFGSVLPSRPAGLRITSKLGVGHSGVVDFEQRYGERARDRLRTFITQSIGVDVLAFDEHFGSLHALFPNSILRSFEHRIVPNVPALAVTALTRLGATLDGCALRLVDHRPHGAGFDITVPLTQTHTLIPIPCDVDELESCFVNGSGEVLFRRRAFFVREIALAMEVGGHAQRQVRDARQPDVVHTVPLQGSSDHVMRSVVGTAPPARGPLILRTAAFERQTQSRDDSVRIFPQGSDAEARAFVRDLIGKASTRCFICDPYIGPRDAYEYATFVRRQRLPIFLLGAREFAGRRIKYVGQATFAGSDERLTSGPSIGERLHQQITSLMAQDPSLNIHCRLMRGKKSPIHDRFIVVDDVAYAIGSSLNEYGSKLTTCIRLSRSADLLAHLNAYWNDDSRSVALAEWVTRVDPEEDA